MNPHADFPLGPVDRVCRSLPCLSIAPGPPSSFLPTFLPTFLLLSCLSLYLPPPFSTFLLPPPSFIISPSLFLPPSLAPSSPFVNPSATAYTTQIRGNGLTKLHITQIKACGRRANILAVLTLYKAFFCGNFSFQCSIIL